MVGRLMTGFLAAMLAVLVFHQPVIWALSTMGMMPPTTRVYNLAATPNGLPAIASLFKSMGFAGWPTLFNQMFWGGVLGLFYALLRPQLPGVTLLKGLLFGLLVVVISNWLIVPLLKGQPIFAGFVPASMMTGALISSAFGIGTALFYSLLRRDA
jgi:uncharacterized membrane protein YagU involved in acid resistance